MFTTSTKPLVLFSIGHSNHAEQKFLDLLKQHGIEVLVDVRSQPSSRYNPQFNSGPLQALVKSAGMRYLFMGDQLGGRPEGEDLVDDEGHALYHKMAESPSFLEGIARLEQGVRKYCVAVMCSEEDPAVCHRYLLVTRVMGERGFDVRHIRGDGSLQSNGEVASQDKQGLLFAELEQDSWKSLRSVLPRRLPPSSSES
jgi:uncharacterized protein (DUF488 family)